MSLPKTKYRVTQAFWHQMNLLAVGEAVFLDGRQAKYIGHCIEAWTDPVTPVVTVTLPAAPDAPAAPAAPAAPEAPATGTGPTVQETEKTEASAKTKRGSADK